MLQDISPAIKASTHIHVGILCICQSTGTHPFAVGGLFSVTYDQLCVMYPAGGKGLNLRWFGWAPFHRLAHSHLGGAGRCDPTARDG